MPSVAFKHGTRGGRKCGVYSQVTAVLLEAEFALTDMTSVKPHTMGILWSVKKGETEAWEL